jgi:hypothetical protein
MSWLPVAPFVILILAAIGIVVVLEIAGCLVDTRPSAQDGQATAPTDDAPGGAKSNAGNQQPVTDAESGQLPSSESGVGDPRDTNAEPRTSGAPATVDQSKPAADSPEAPDHFTEPEPSDDARDASTASEPNVVNGAPPDVETPGTKEEDERNAHPLIVEITKEGYNVWAELKAALDEGAYRDVLRTMRLTPTDMPLGLLPDPTDESLFIPFTSLLAVATQDHPQLQAAI